MRAVILAAGEGSRIRLHFNEPKPLIKLQGLSLIERNILSLKECGITEFIIITGCYAEEIENYLGDGSAYKVNIRYINNPDWKLGNGVSVFSFQKEYRKNEKFILLMADHIFQLDTLRSFVRRAENFSNDEILLGADKRLDTVWDIEETTKIKFNKDKALQLGKKLENYNGVDCGLFIGTGALLSALERAIAQKCYSLTDGVNLLAQDGKVKLHFINENWIDVDDLASYKQAEKILLKSLIPAKDGLISSVINRKFSLRITKVISKTSITPNQITFLSFFTAFWSAISFAFDLSILGGFLAQFCSILDGVDGEIARLKFSKSKYGGLFDAILDRYGDYLIIIGMSLSWIKESQSAVAFWFCIAATSGIPMSMLIKEKYQTVTGKIFIPKDWDGKLQYLPTNRDGRLFIIMLGGILDLVPVSLVMLAFMTHLQALVRLINLRKID